MRAWRDDDVIKLAIGIREGQHARCTRMLGESLTRTKKRRRWLPVGASSAVRTARAARERRSQPAPWKKEEMMENSPQDFVRIGPTRRCRGTSAKRTVASCEPWRRRLSNKDQEGEREGTYSSSPWCKVRWRVSNDSKSADAVHVDCGGTTAIFRVGRRCPGRVDGEQQAVLTASAVALSLDEIQMRRRS
jgi:hypothetical protein